MTTNGIEGNFGEASLKAWHDLEKKRFSPQDFRSFVQSALENAGVNPNMIAPLIGHKPKGVDFHYSEHDIQELLEKFKSALPYLLPQTVESVKAEVNGITESMREQITFLQRQLDGLENDSLHHENALVRRINELEEEVNKLTGKKKPSLKESAEKIARKWIESEKESED